MSPYPETTGFAAGSARSMAPDEIRMTDECKRTHCESSFNSAGAFFLTEPDYIIHRLKN